MTMGSKKLHSRGKKTRAFAFVFLILLCAQLVSLAPVSAQVSFETNTPSTNSYIQRNLIVNRYDPNDPTSPPNARLIDPLLVNPWGAAIRPAGLGGHYWFANAGSSTVTTYVGDVYDRNGTFIPIHQDALKVVPVDGSPIGQVFNGSQTGFLVSGSICSDDGVPTCAPGEPTYVGEFSGPSRFIVVTEEGKIAAWTEGRINGQFGRMRKFHTVLDNSENGSLYRGVAVTERESNNWLCAANFSKNRIDVYDGQWQRVRYWTTPGSNHRYKPFQKPRDIPANYVPFNIQYLDGKFFVTYAELILPCDEDYDPNEPFTERACPGCGYVAIFNSWGKYISTLEGHRRLNAPWGLAIAPSNFGKFSNTLLVGNFGDGTIIGFNLHNGRQIGYLRDEHRRKISINGLWAIFFGNGASLGRSDYLYFTAGLNDETDGLFGSLNWTGASNPNP